MFTGLVERLGKTHRIVHKGGEAVLVLAAEFPESVIIGESIAVNGVCLTVTGSSSGVHEFDVSEETLKRSNLGFLKPGDSVNLERALRLNDRLGGHLVTGHIDAVGRILIKKRSLSSVIMRVGVPSEVSRYLVPKGSVGVDGISLTVNRTGEDFFEVNLIPHTVELTTLKIRDEGDSVNIETDLIGKYVERMLQPHSAGGDGESRKGLTLDALSRHGFL